MDGKENIIAKIIQNAENQRKITVDEAQVKIDEIAEYDKFFCDNLTAKTDREMKDCQLSTVARRKSVAELDVKKLLLKAKQQTITSVFEEAEKAICGLPDVKYSAFIEKLIKTYAEDGDMVIISQNDAKRITEEFIAKIAKQLNIALKYSNDGDFSGGVILSGKKCDKNLTVKMLLKEYREQSEMKIASMLFEVK